VGSHHPKGLAPIDPLAIPLPHGTEVTTRVDRLAGNRRVPQGVVGRVVAIREDGLDVLVTGVGVLRYARDELMPRRPGQVRFAEQRAADWDALRPCVVLEATVGSRAWGLADEGSDTDLRGVFALPLSWTSGLVEPPHTLTSADGSVTYWEHRKAIHQAVRADPNTLELLFVPTTRAVDPIGEWLLEERDAFVSADLFGSFGRYAVSQLGKLARSARLAEHRGVVLDWLKEEPELDLDTVAARLAAISPRPARTPEDAVFGAKEYLKQLYRSLHDQGLLDANDFGALVRYARSGGNQPEPARELRPKNAYNLLRLIHVATDWLRTGHPQMEMTGRVRERLLQIKRGEVGLDSVLAEAERLVPALEAARDATPLPRRPDIARADALLRRIGEEVARRWVARVPGPFGADAPPPPPIQQEPA
jgi:RNA repair pathway DNA polymerase beta family